jgi:hypothetical protein
VQADLGFYGLGVFNASEAVGTCSVLGVRGVGVYVRMCYRFWYYGLKTFLMLTLLAMHSLGCLLFPNVVLQS